jgi:hypothetical protein
MAVMAPWFPAPSSPPPVRGFRWTLAHARSEEKVRGVIALVLVGVLVGLVFDTPAEPATAIASAKTLAISVIAFYFGLHNGTPQAPPQPKRADHGGDEVRAV